VTLARVIAVAATLGLLGCSRSCARTTADFAVDAAVPSDTEIAVEVEGSPASRIDGPLLARTPPDFVTPPWRGWKLAKLVPGWTTNAAIDVEDDEGIHATLIAPGEDTTGSDAVLLVGPDGETRAIRLAAGRPITAHQGASRKDSGRVRHVKRIRVRSRGAAENEPAVAVPPISLKVNVEGSDATWTRAELGRVAPIVLMSKDGDGERHAWALRELTATLVGKDAFVLELVGEDGRVLRIAEAQWRDPAQVPVLRANRRGRLKFVWLSRENEELEDAGELKGITEVRLRRHR
jgi:hypothetical protein